MIKPIIIAMMLVSSSAFAERSLTAQVARITGCSELLMAELSPDRKSVMTQVKNVSAQLDLIAKIKGKAWLKLEVGSSFEELDAKLAQIATDLIDNKVNALKSADLLEMLNSLRGRLLSGMSSLEAMNLDAGDERITYADAEMQPVPLPPSFDPYRYANPPGRRDPPREKP